MLHCYTQSKHIDLAKLRRWDDLAYDWRQQLVESPLGWGSGAGLWTLGLTLTDHGSSGRWYQHPRGQKTTAGDFWSKFGWGKKWRKASNLGGMLMDFDLLSTHFMPSHRSSLRAIRAATQLTGFAPPPALPCAGDLNLAPKAPWTLTSVAATNQKPGKHWSILMIHKSPLKRRPPVQKSCDPKDPASIFW